MSHSTISDLVRTKYGWSFRLNFSFIIYTKLYINHKQISDWPLETRNYQILCMIFLKTIHRVLFFTYYKGFKRNNQKFGWFSENFWRLEIAWFTSLKGRLLNKITNSVTKMTSISLFRLLYLKISRKGVKKCLGNAKNSL